MCAMLSEAADSPLASILLFTKDLLCGASHCYRDSMNLLGQLLPNSVLAHRDAYMAMFPFSGRLILELRARPILTVVV